MPNVDFLGPGAVLRECIQSYPLTLAMTAITGSVTAFLRCRRRFGSGPLLADAPWAVAVLAWALESNVQTWNSFSVHARSPFAQVALVLIPLLSSVAALGFMV